MCFFRKLTTFSAFSQCCLILKATVSRPWIIANALSGDNADPRSLNKQTLARVCLLRDLGSALSPDNAFAIIQGLETVALRMRQHCENAEKVVNFLKKHKEVTKVIYSTEHIKPLAKGLMCSVE